MSTLCYISYRLLYTKNLNPQNVLWKYWIAVFTPQWRFNNNTVNSSVNGGLDSCRTFGNQTVNMVWWRWCIIISPSVIWNGWFGIKIKVTYTYSESSCLIKLWLFHHTLHMNCGTRPSTWTKWAYMLTGALWMWQREYECDSNYCITRNTAGGILHAEINLVVFVICTVLLNSFHSDEWTQFYPHHVLYQILKIGQFGVFIFKERLPEDVVYP